jgi:N-acetyl-1-D-myo-inositol-2-amino-2-deoxy-alpha-D-glucopyranoside deacetylase
MADGGLLLVHAHPDDESIGTGATMACYVDLGRRVTLVTCTRGEEGEIVAPHLAALGTGRALGARRVDELAAAMRALGVTDHRFLGDYEDSGMIGTPPNDRPAAFWNADVNEATDRLLEVFREVAPDVVVTYDENGGYGHPDHIQAHRVALAAFDAARGETWAPRRLYASVFRPPGRRRREVDDYNAAGRPGGYDDPPDVDAPYDGPPVTTVVDASTYLGAKLAAIAAHETQLTVHAPFFALTNNIVHEAFGVEHFALLRGDPAGADPL